jgi:hypothetical protein
MRQEEGFIYSFDTITYNGALLQKQGANATLSDPWWAVLPYISLYINVWLSSKQVKQIKCGTRFDRCYWRVIKVFPPFSLLYINYDRCFKLSIPSIYHKLFKYKNVNQFFPSKISCESFFPIVIFLSKWIFIKGECWDVYLVYFDPTFQTKMPQKDRKVGLNFLGEVEKFLLPKILDIT